MGTLPTEPVDADQVAGCDIETWTKSAYMSLTVSTCCLCEITFFFVATIKKAKKKKTKTQTPRFLIDVNKAT